VHAGIDCNGQRRDLNSLKTTLHSGSAVVRVDVPMLSTPTHPVSFAAISSLFFLSTTGDDDDDSMLRYACPHLSTPTHTCGLVNGDGVAVDYRESNGQTQLKARKRYLDEEHLMNVMNTDDVEI